MNNQTEKKWYQKPITVILSLILFFPVGLLLMWKHEVWTKTTRLIVTGILGLFLIANIAGKNRENASNRSNNNSNTSVGTEKTEMIHRCGRTWNGKPDKTYGIYGNYCSERCYADLYPN